MAANDKAIISAMASSPDKGFRLLLDAYGKSVYWHIRRLVVSHDDAQDAAQETFVRVFRSFGQRRQDRSLAAWIYRIATNEALRLIARRHSQWASLDSGDEHIGEQPADTYIDYSDVETVKLQKAILSLPTKQQLAFNMRYYDEMDYRDIAAATGSTEAAAKANYHVAKDKIIKYMQTHD